MGYEKDKARSQVIIVVKEDWKVLCFDSTLKLLWEKAIKHKAHESETLINMFKISDISVYIAPLEIQDGVDGVVIIGASMSQKGDDPESIVHFEDGIDMKENPDIEHPFMHAKAKLEHFSIYCFDAKNGNVLWQHDGLDIRTEQYSKSLPQHAYSLDIRDLMTQVHHAPGISDWTIFRQSIIDELPHTWNSPLDTSISIAHFIRRHIGAGSGQQVKKKLDSNGKNAIKKDKTSTTKIVHKKFHLLSEVKTHDISISDSLPHDAAEHTENPNVIIAHTKNGLEVISLTTGVPITSIALTKRKTFADLDGDGVVDNIIILDTEDSVTRHEREYISIYDNSISSKNERLKHCTIVVTSGIPAKSQLFNNSICREWTSINDRRRAVPTSISVPNQILFATPLVLSKIDMKTLKESNHKDLIVAINTGTISSFSSSGELNWQFNNAPMWSENDQSLPAVLAFDSDADRAEEYGSHNSIHSSLLITGNNLLQLLSRDGVLLASADIPQSPILYPIVGDFDNDGVTDVTIVTEDSVLGYHLEVVKSSHGILIAIIILSLVAFIVFISNIQTVALTSDSNDSNNDYNHSKRNKRSNVGSVLKIIRSTDEHLD